MGPRTSEAQPGSLATYFLAGTPRLLRQGQVDAMVLAGRQHNNSKLRQSNPAMVSTVLSPVRQAHSNFEDSDVADEEDDDDDPDGDVWD